jgi:Protein involved in formate dehydrogenase formation
VSAEPVRVDAGPWEARRLRAEELCARYPFAQEMLTLYLALWPVQKEAWQAVRADPPAAAGLARWAAAAALPAVIDATAAAGPAALREAIAERGTAGDAALSAWLAGEELDAVDTYLARASLAPALEALGGGAAAACAPARAEGGGALCPCCGGLPQRSVVAESGDPLVTAPRSLVCARCGTSWRHTRSACPACGESDEGRLLVYAEQWTGPVIQDGNGDGGGVQPSVVFPNLRIVGCSSCRHYLIEIDLARDSRAVPEVDELAALPLDLYAADRGLTKVTPNLMGF